MRSVLMQDQREQSCCMVINSLRLHLDLFMTTTKNINTQIYDPHFWWIKKPPDGFHHGLTHPPRSTHQLPIDHTVHLLGKTPAWRLKTIFKTYGILGRRCYSIGWSFRLLCLSAALRIVKKRCKIGP